MSATEGVEERLHRRNRRVRLLVNIEGLGDPEQQCMAVTDEVTVRNTVLESQMERAICVALFARSLYPETGTAMVAAQSFSAKLRWLRELLLELGVPKAEVSTQYLKASTEHNKIRNKLSHRAESLVEEGEIVVQQRRILGGNRGRPELLRYSFAELDNTYFRANHDLSEAFERVREPLLESDEAADFFP